MRNGRAFSRGFMLAGLAAAIPAAFAAGAPTCPDVAEPPASFCLTTAHGLAYAGTQDDARLAATALDEAVVRFEHVFGRRLPPGLLVLSATFSGEDAQRFAQSHGLGFPQSWLSPADKRAQVETVMRRATPDADASRVAAVVSQIEAQHVDTVRHELGHAQYRAAFWPDTAPSQEVYGTPAPDWLDEASAVLLEGDASRAARERHFSRRNAGRRPRFARSRNF